MADRKVYERRNDEASLFGAAGQQGVEQASEQIITAAVVVAFAWLMLRGRR
jgi:hypothetical protein